MKKALKVILIIAAVWIGFIILFNIIFLIQASKAVAWNIREPVSSESKDFLGNVSMYPDAMPYMERYGTRGWQDIEYRVETVRFESMEILAETFPNAKNAITSALEQEAKETKDLEDTSVKEYEINLPTKKEEELSSKYKDIYDFYFRSFAVDVYEDGSVRLILRVWNI